MVQIKLKLKKKKKRYLLRFRSTVLTAWNSKVAFDSAYSTKTIRSFSDVFITRRNCFFIGEEEEDEECFLVWKESLKRELANNKKRDDLRRLTRHCRAIELFHCFESRRSCRRRTTSADPTLSVCSWCNCALWCRWPPWSDTRGRPCWQTRALDLYHSERVASTGTASAAAPNPLSSIFSRCNCEHARTAAF